MLVKQNSVNFLKIAIKNFLTPTLVVGVKFYTIGAAAIKQQKRKENKMKNETKDFFTSDDEEINISAEEIVLAPDEEIYAEAAQIATASAEDVKYPFIIKYDVNWKEFLLDMIDKCGGVVKEEINATELSVSVNMAQLKFIKALDCVEGVRVESIAESLKSESDSTDFKETSVLTTEAENSIITTEVQMSDVTEASVASPNTATPRCTTESCCCGGSTMETAIPLTVEELTSVHICCPGSEVWYKFDIEKDRDYTIYSSGGTATGGHLDTIGTLYDADGNQLAYNDDHNGMLYFKICEYLYEGYTYYLKVQVDNNKTGNFYIKVTRDVLVESVTISPSTKTVNVGDTFALSATIFPDNAEDKRVRWTSYDDNIAEVDYTKGIVTTKSAGTVNICAYAMDGSGVSAYCSVTVKSVPVSSVTITPASKIMAVGSATTLTATVLPTNATNKTIVWSSSDENIATVIPSTGYVLAKNPGTTNIWAFSQDGSGQYMNCSVTIRTPPDTSKYSWQELGFSYDGSVRDFNRLNNDLPPYAYEEWCQVGYGYSEDPYLDTITVNYDAIYVVDYGEDGLDCVGHAYLLLKNNDGSWLRTEFAGPDKPNAKVNIFSENPTSIVSALSVKVKEDAVEYSLPVVGDPSTSVPLIFTYYVDGVQYYPIKGNFSASIDMANEWVNQRYNGYYFLTTNNCLHYVRDVLREGTAAVPSVESYIHSSITPVPKSFYDGLKEINLGY